MFRTKRNSSPEAIWNTCVEYALYGGISKEEYQSSESVIRQRNQETLALGSIMLTLMFAGLYLSSFFSNAIAVTQMFYALMLIVCALIAILTVTLVKRQPQFVLPAWYVLFAAFGCYAMLLNTWFRPDLSSTTLCVFFVAGPLLIIDRPVRVLGFMFLLDIVEAFVVSQTKSSYLAFVDDVNMTCCLVLGAAIYLRLTRVRLREIRQAQLLKRERDTDRLTMMLNKTAAEEQIRQKMNDSRRGALLIMDLDHFKLINDVYGHAFGDFVLKHTADCIRDTFPEGAVFGRFGGDEFIGFVSEISDDAVEQRLEVLLDELGRTVRLADTEKKIEASIGVAYYPRHALEYETLFGYADEALYAAKNQGRNRYAVFEQI